MKIAVVGGGFTGLAAAYELTKRGHNVTVFEREDHLGGLAWGFKRSNWDWHLEAAYHHLFTNDHAIINLIHELGLDNKLIIKRPITANYLSTTIAQLDSPFHLLTFPGLSMIDKLRTGALAAFCKLYPFWRTLEGITAKKFFTTIGGKQAWEIIWEPLMTGKFGHLDNTIAASWLWARIHKRTPTLAYIEGGFQTLVHALAQAIKKQGGTIHTNTPMRTLPTNDFDRILLTTPTSVAGKLLGDKKVSEKIPHLHAQVLVLETKEPILKDVYWLNITDRTFPFLAVVAHTNFMDKRHYGGHHLTYIGNYLPPDHPYLTFTKQELLKNFLPFLERITDYELRITNSYLFVGPYAQPVHQLHYSKKAPKLQTPMRGVYLANMDSIYPWDRGTNYAVELGQKVAAAILSSAI